MTALSAKLQQKKISAKMANGGTTAILVDMLKRGLVRKLTTCQAFDLVAVKSMMEDWPKHVETDIDQYANPHNCGAVVNQLDVMVAGGTEVDVDFNCNVNTHSDGSFQHNTGGHQDTAAGAMLTIITMPVARRCNPGIVDRVTTVTTPGECIGAIVTEEGVAVNPARKDLLAKLAGKSESELGFKLVTIQELRARGIEKAGRQHCTPRTKERVIGVMEWRDGTVLDVVRQPLDRKGMGVNSARVEVNRIEGTSRVEAQCVDDCPYVTPDQAKSMASAMLTQFGMSSGFSVSIRYDYAKDFILSASVETALRKAAAAAGSPVPISQAFSVGERKAYPPPARKRPLRRSHMYIPGADGYMVGKGPSSGADAVILDLEDAVDPSQKEFARTVVRNALRGGVDFGGVEKMVRINGVNELGFADIEGILPHASVDVMVVPKVESAKDIADLEKKICSVLGVASSPVLLLGLIETAQGVEKAFEIAASSPNLIGVSMGLEDYTADRGVERTESDEESQWALQRVANAATAAGIVMVDVVYSTLDDNDGLEKACARAKKMGMFGKRCIHPNQVPVVNKCFNPDKPDIDESCAALTAFAKAEAGVGVVKITGKKGKPKMVDKPVLIRAMGTVALALAAGLVQKDPWEKTMAEVAKRLGL
jgi:citrate lyase beta subunit